MNRIFKSTAHMMPPEPSASLKHRCSTLLCALVIVAGPSTQWAAQAQAAPENLRSAWTTALKADHRIREAGRAIAAAGDELASLGAIVLAAGGWGFRRQFH